MGVPVKHGTYLYAGTITCDVRIVRSPVRCGTGDYQDPRELADDQPMDYYYVEFGSSTQRDVYHAGGGGAPTLDEAIRIAEQAPGIGRTIRWDD